LENKRFRIELLENENRQLREQLEPAQLQAAPISSIEDKGGGSTRAVKQDSHTSA